MYWNKKINSKFLFLVPHNSKFINHSKVTNLNNNDNIEKDTDLVTKWKTNEEPI